MGDAVDMVPTEDERRAWVAGRQMLAVRSYRARVMPDVGLQAAVVAFETATSVERTFVVMPTVRLGGRKDE